MQVKANFIALYYLVQLLTIVVADPLTSDLGSPTFLHISPAEAGKYAGSTNTSLRPTYSRQSGSPLIQEMWNYYWAGFYDQGHPRLEGEQAGAFTHKLRQETGYYITNGILDPVLRAAVERKRSPFRLIFVSTLGVIVSLACVLVFSVVLEWVGLCNCGVTGLLSFSWMENIFHDSPRREEKCERCTSRPLPSVPSYLPQTPLAFPGVRGKARDRIFLH